MKRWQRGLTMIETILCLGLITVAALGLIAALTRLMVAQSSSSHQTVARIIADSRLQKALLSGPGANWNPDPGLAPEFTPVYAVGDVLQEEVRVGQNGELVVFYYCIPDPPAPTRIDPPASFDSPATPMMGDMWKVTIRVWWNSDDSGPESAVERGTQTLEVTALTYIET
jgi:type II secretory pathway pseudopilin PulG